MSPSASSSFVVGGEGAIHTATEYPVGGVRNFDEEGQGTQCFSDPDRWRELFPLPHILLNRHLVQVHPRAPSDVLPRCTNGWKR